MSPEWIKSVTPGLLLPVLGPQMYTHSPTLNTYLREKAILQEVTFPYLSINTMEPLFIINTI